MFNRSEIFRKAWAAYRKVAAMLGSTAFAPARFAFALRCAWADAKLELQVYRQMAREATSRADDAAADAVFAFLKGVGTEADAQAAVAKSQRVEAIRDELRDMEMGDFVPWARRSALTAELARLA